MDLVTNLEPGAMCRYLESEDEIDEVGACLRNSDITGDTMNISIEKILPPNDGTFYFFLDSNRPDESSFLYYEIDVPDVISRIEGGECELCDGSRFVCPCYACYNQAGNGDKGEMEANFSLLCYPCVEIACPVCMGIYFSQNHLFDLVEKDPRERASYWEEQIFGSRLRELGYSADMKQETMLRAIRHPLLLGPGQGGDWVYEGQIGSHEEGVDDVFHGYLE